MYKYPISVHSYLLCAYAAGVTAVSMETVAIQHIYHLVYIFLIEIPDSCRCAWGVHKHVCNYIYIGLYIYIGDGWLESKNLSFYHTHLLLGIYCL